MPKHREAEAKVNLPERVGRFIILYRYAWLYSRQKGGKMDFYTTVLKKSGQYWVALCLENGLVGQGTTREESILRLKEAIDSLEEVRLEEKDVYNAPISIKELHEFLIMDGKDIISQPLEFRAVYA